MAKWRNFDGARLHRQGPYDSYSRSGRNWSPPTPTSPNEFRNPNYKGKNYDPNYRWARLIQAIRNGDHKGKNNNNNNQNQNKKGDKKKDKHVKWETSQRDSSSRDDTGSEYGAYSDPDVVMHSPGADSPSFIACAYRGFSPVTRDADGDVVMCMCDGSSVPACFAEAYLRLRSENASLLSALIKYQVETLRAYLVTS